MKKIINFLQLLKIVSGENRLLLVEIFEEEKGQVTFMNLKKVTKNI